MKKKLTILILVITVPVLFFMAWFISERSFSLSMEREKQRVQMTESIVSRVIQKTMMQAEYINAVAYAQQYHDYYLSQGIELIFCWNSQPIAGAHLPDSKYTGLLQGQRSALLDTENHPEKYAVAEPVNSHLTMILLRDISDLYLLRNNYQSLAFGCAGIASVLLCILAMIFAGILTHPIRNLTHAAQALAKHTGQEIPLPVARRDEIGALAQAFSDMQEAIQTRENKLRDESNSRQALLDALAHEMRTPLTSLLGNARLLQGELPTEERKRIADSMAREIYRLSDMDQQLMKLTTLRHENIESESVSVLSILNDTAERLNQQADGITIEVTGQDSILYGDRELLSLLSDNLTANAIHASEPGMKILLIAESHGFSVQDQGIGMTEETIQRACEPFWKADKARTRSQGGAGLGLSLCQQIAELHQGTLSFDSSPGVGTKVIFTTSIQPVDDSVTCSVS
jgi:signal transduction histidine kinase